jgi:NifU-like protein involved in Fe-S cluster formation
MEETNLIIQEYSKNPLCNFSMESYTIKQHEWNFICGDDIVVYLDIGSDDIIKWYSFDWNCSTVTMAAASLLSEFIVWASISDVLTRDYNKMFSIWFEVSPRRRRAAVIALLAARNAIHKYLTDDKEDVFDDVLWE